MRGRGVGQCFLVQTDLAAKQPKERLNVKERQQESAQGQEPEITVPDVRVLMGQSRLQSIVRLDGREPAWKEDRRLQEADRDGMSNSLADHEPRGGILGDEAPEAGRGGRRGLLPAPAQQNGLNGPHSSQNACEHDVTQQIGGKKRVLHFQEAVSEAELERREFNA